MKQSRAHSAPKHRAIRTSRHLHVAQRQHTGHLLPRRNTSYPVLIMLMLCVGVLLFTWTRLVTADSASYTVSASVPGPPPAVAASVDSPSNGSQFTATPIVVKGSCPLNSYVMLLRNGFSSGVGICQADGSYQITTDLFRGTNQLVARVYSFTDLPGPDSAMVTVSYSPPGPAGGSAGSPSAAPGVPYRPGNTTGLPEPLLLKANFTLLGYYTGQPAAWQVRLEGGAAPYAVAVDWGDGQQSLYSERAPTDLNLSHVYRQPGGYRGSYVVRISVSDSQGGQTVLQLIAIVSSPSKTVAGGAASMPGSGGLFGGGSIGRMLGYGWTGYGIVLLMLISFWLGERRESDLLHPSHKRRARA